MNKPLSVTSKIIALAVLAIAFGATMIALSARGASDYDHESGGYGNDSRKFSNAFTVQPGGNLVLNSDVGDIRIKGGIGDQVTVAVMVKGSERHIRKFDVQFNQEENTVSIDGKLEGGFSHFFEGMSLDVVFEVIVPGDFNVTLHTSGGDIDVHHVTGVLKGHTSGGDVTLGEASGTVSMTTSGGDIKVKHSAGDLTLETSGGDITGSSVSGTVSVETSGGDISFSDTDAKFTGSTSGGDIKLYVQEHKGIDVSTSGGDVIIKVPSTAAATVDAYSTGGDVNSDLEFTGKMKDGTMEGTINGGGEMIRARTSGGDITIEKLER